MSTAVALGVVSCVTAIVVMSGVIPIKASSGHWKITAWLLDFAKVRSVALYASRIEAPLLDDPALILRGAGHYETGCASCHGGPGGSAPPVMAAMTPLPPELSGHVARWTPEELFYIVKHGIKFTGMPAWPAQTRDDEVWGMVAFLRRMPALDGDAYRALVYGAPPPGANGAPQVVRQICWRCHGVDGQGRGPGAFPTLAGQRAEYLHRSLHAFANRTRFSGIMGAIAASVGDQAMREAATYYEKLPSRAPDAVLDQGAVRRGESIARLGVPARDIPPCAECHGPGGPPRNSAYPILAAQHVAYLESQLRLLQERRRGGSGYENIMHTFVGRLRPEEVTDVTRFYATSSHDGRPAAAR